MNGGTRIMDRTAGWMLIAALAGVAAPAAALPTPSTRLVACPSGDCLLVSGRRETGDASVTLNGHPVAVEGGRRWQFRLPVATLRTWCEANARSVSIGVAGVEMRAKLPIGMMVRPQALTMLVIRTK